MNSKLKKLTIPGVILLILLIALNWYIQKLMEPEYSDSVQNVPAFSGDPYVVINQNQPEFTEQDYTTDSYEYFSPLDSLGRCGYTMACIGIDLMPTDDRESISHVKPSGWVQAQYDFVDGKNLYNRCHLIGFQLTGENDNERNLITGTRYLNIDGMLPFENMVADYVKETQNHVLYRVTPVYEGDNLVAKGVQMEAWSVEDNGEGICFHVYVYNAQPGVQIDYATGRSWSVSDNTEESPDLQSGNTHTYILNTSSMRFHTETCTNGQNIKKENQEYFTGSREELIDKGYMPSGCCHP